MIPVIIVILFFGSAVIVGVYQGITGNSTTEETTHTKEIKENNNITSQKQRTLTIEEQQKIAYKTVDNYMKDIGVNYTIEVNKDGNLIVVKFPVNDAQFRIDLVYGHEKGYAKEVLEFISTHSKKCMELIVEKGCNDIGVEFAIVDENNTDGAYMATINGKVIINVFESFTE